MVQSEIRTYRSCFWTLWRWTTAFCSLLGAIYYVMCLLSGGLPVHVLPTAGWSLGIGTLFAVAVVLSPVYVSPEGMRCYNFWGVYQSIGWHDLGAIFPVNFLGLRYLRVTSAANPAADIWLPLYLSRSCEFAADVRQHLGDDHPLVDALETHHA